MRLSRAFLLGSCVFICGVQAAGAAVMNRPPPVGPLILDLNGTPIVHSYAPYHTTFVATGSSTDLSFAFRDDSFDLFLDDVSVSAAGGPNLVTNGTFDAGPVGAAAPEGWSYLPTRGIMNGGQVASAAGPDQSNAYEDGAVGGYDAITQRLATMIGATYTVSFMLEETGSFDTYRDLSSNGLPGSGGNGVDLLVYAGSGLPMQTVVPLPGSALLFGVALVCLGAVGSRRTANSRP